MQDNRHTATGIREALLTFLEVKTFLSSIRSSASTPQLAHNFTRKSLGASLLGYSNQARHRKAAAGMNRLVLFARPRFRSVRSTLTRWQKEAAVRQLAWAHQLGSINWSDEAATTKTPLVSASVGRCMVIDGESNSTTRHLMTLPHRITAPPARLAAEFFAALLVPASFLLRVWSRIVSNPRPKGTWL
jgi:hypothetical protein